MRKLIVFLNLLMLGSSAGVACYGKAVDESMAKKTGTNYLISNGVPGVNSTGDLTTGYVAKSEINGVSVADYYVFNFTNGNGFVMVSADDKIIPVLAYSGETVFDINHIAPATKAWIEGYKNQIAYVIEHDLPAQPGTPESWSELTVASKVLSKTTATFPSSTYFLCSTKWDQALGYGCGNYNALCPTGSGGQAVTGCVATAMAQVMKFWSWPSKGCGSHTYTQNPNPHSYAAQTADFGNTYYQWGSMPNNFTAGTNIPIATIMFHAGVSTDMDYDPNGSGTYVLQSQIYGSNPVACAEYALKTYFHYKRSLTGLLRAGSSELFTGFHIPAQAAYTTTGWVNMIEAELNAGRPLLYMGQEAVGGGHCWVCDGYDATNKMHFNWGWSGASNGYYTVDNLAPPALGTGGGSGNFNLDQGVVAGIMPDSLIYATGNIKLSTQVDIPTNSPISYLSPFVVNAKITNANTSAFNGSISARVYDTLNNYVGTVQTLTGQSIAAGATSGTLTFTTSGLLAMIPSKYVVRIMYQATGTTTWTAVGDNGNFINYNLLDVRLHDDLLELYSSLNVTSGVTMISGHALTVSTQIMNFMNFAYSGSFQAVLVNVANNTSYVVQELTGQSVAYHGHNSFTFTNSAMNVPSGTYVLAIRYQRNGTGAYYIVGSDYYVNPIIIKVTSGVGVNNPVVNEGDIVVYPNPATESVTINSSNSVIDAVTVTDMAGRLMVSYNNDSKDQMIKMPVSELASGTYLFQLHTSNGIITKKIVVAK